MNKDQKENSYSYFKDSMGCCAVVLYDCSFGALAGLVSALAVLISNVVLVVIAEMRIHAQI